MFGKLTFRREELVWISADEPAMLADHPLQQLRLLSAPRRQSLDPASLSCLRRIPELPGGKRNKQHSLTTPIRTAIPQCKLQHHRSEPPVERHCLG